MNKWVFSDVAFWLAQFSVITWGIHTDISSITEGFELGNEQFNKVNLGWGTYRDDDTVWHNNVQMAGNRLSTGMLHWSSWQFLPMKQIRKGYFKFFSAYLLMLQSVRAFSDIKWLNAINLKWSDFEDRRRTQTSVDCIRAISDGNTCFISLNWHANPLPLAIYKCHFM